MIYVIEGKLLTKHNSHIIMLLIRQLQLFSYVLIMSIKTLSTISVACCYLGGLELGSRCV